MTDPEIPVSRGLAVIERYLEDYQAIAALKDALVVGHRLAEQIAAHDQRLAAVKAAVAAAEGQGAAIEARHAARLADAEAVVQAAQTTGATLVREAEVKAERIRQAVDADSREQREAAAQALAETRQQVGQWAARAKAARQDAEAAQQAAAVVAAQVREATEQLATVQAALEAFKAQHFGRVG